MITVLVEKNNHTVKFVIDGNNVNVYNSNNQLLRTVTTESENEKATLRNIIYSNYSSNIQVLDIT